MLGFAANPLPTQAVEVTGVGDTRAAARHDAYRAAVEKVVGSYVTADLITENEELPLLLEALLGHSDGRLEADLTVQACWDADRLDLGRVCVIPNPRMLCSMQGQRDLKNLPDSFQSPALEGWQRKSPFSNLQTRVRLMASASAARPT